MSRKDPNGKFGFVDAISASYMQNTIAIQPVITLGGIVKGAQILAAIGVAALTVMTIEKALEWEETSRNEPPIRLQHYTTEQGASSILAAGCIQSPRSNENYFTRYFYASSEEAAEKNATEWVPDVYFSLNLFRNADGLFGPRPVMSKIYPSGITRSGGGEEWWTETPVFIYGPRRGLTGPIPITD